VTISWLLFSFQGRISRKAFWFANLIVIVAEVVAAMADKLLFGRPDYLLSGLTVLAALVSNFAITSKRLHDRDRSAWWILILLVPLVGAIWLFVQTGFLRGEAGPNRFGPDPLDGSPAPGRF
jgi:uncharacterized membrane protein YhaH (DUF805 family)